MSPVKCGISRGADGRILRAVVLDFSDARVAMLSVNFRSTPQIVAAANAIGAALPLRLALHAASPPGPPPVFRAAADELEEAASIADEVVRLLGSGAIRDLSDVAILIRVNAQAPRRCTRVARSPFHQARRRTTPRQPAIPP